MQRLGYQACLPSDLRVTRLGYHPSGLGRRTISVFDDGEKRASFCCTLRQTISFATLSQVVTIKVPGNHNGTQGDICVPGTPRPEKSPRAASATVSMRCVTA